MMAVSFTDRYGGRSPSWLRACLGQCEATGYVPARLDGDGALEYREAWHRAERAEPSDDGWHFLRCHDCGGSGRVSWATTVRRLPRWWARGVGILVNLARHARRYRAPWVRPEQYVRLVAGAAFLEDLRGIRR